MSFFPFPKEGKISISDFQDEMGRMMDRLYHGGLSTGPLDGQDWAPSVDVIEEPSRYVAVAEVPGLTASDCQLSYSAGVLVISGTKRPCPLDSGDPPASVVRRERRFGKFSRRIELPLAIDADKIEARCRNGLLEISLPKTAEAIPRPIAIEVEE